MTDPAETVHELSITREFDAPVSLVFGVWSDRKHVLRWWAPQEFTTAQVELDFRVGGAYRVCIASDKRGESWMGGHYVEIVENRRIVFTFAWEDGRDQPGIETLVTVTFEERGGRTRQTLHQAPFLHADGRDRHIGGWNQVFDREQTYLEKLFGLDPRGSLSSTNAT